MWIVKIIDNAMDTVEVLGDGSNESEAEVDALAKWDAVMQARDDYEDRLPASAIGIRSLSDAEFPQFIV